MKKIHFFLIIIFGWGFLSTSSYGQKIVVYPEKNTLCLASKIRGKNYMLEDGDVIYNGEKIAETHSGCFNAPPRLCTLDTTREMVFQPKNLYKYFKKTIPFALTGKKVWRKRGNSRVKLLTCFPHERFKYRRDNFTVKIAGYSELQRLKVAIPYVANVQVQDAGLLKVVRPYVKECVPRDTTCLIYNSYKSVIEKLSYKNDPYSGGGDFIRTPRQTLKDKGGDCEDLTGVLVSFLANLKIESYVLMTQDHAYAMACGVDSKRLQQYIRNGLTRSVSKTEKVNLKYGQTELYYFGLSGGIPSGKIKWHFSVKGQHPFNFLVTPGKVTINQIKSKNYKYSRNCSGINITQINTSCELGSTITLVINFGGNFSGITVPYDPNKKNLNNKIKITFKGDYNLADINQVTVHYYSLKKNGKDTYCVVLEPTAGDQGYPGYSQVKNQWSIAVNPITWDWFYLKNPQVIYQ